jgi:hypothetical protein
MPITESDMHIKTTMESALFIDELKGAGDIDTQI